MTPRYAGAVLNLICVVLLAVVVAALCEYRMRRHGGLLKFSLANLFIATLLLAICIAWTVQEHQQNVLQEQFNRELDELIAQAETRGDSFSTYLEYESRFPLIVAQLLNFGKYPWGRFPNFCRVESGILSVVLNETSSPKFVSKITELAGATEYLVELEVMKFSPERVRMLKAFRNAKIVSLNISFDARYWLYDELGSGVSEATKSRKLTELKVDLDIDMSNLKAVDLYLDETISQTDQLRQFMGLPKLEEAFLSGLTNEGAKFILENKTRWPKAMQFDLLYDVSEELRQELESEFDAELIGGVF